MKADSFLIRLLQAVAVGAALVLAILLMTGPAPAQDCFSFERHLPIVVKSIERSGGQAKVFLYKNPTDPDLEYLIALNSQAPAMAGGSIYQKGCLMMWESTGETFIIRPLTPLTLETIKASEQVYPVKT